MWPVEYRSLGTSVIHLTRITYTAIPAAIPTPSGRP